MTEDKITLINEKNETKEYKLLLIIEKEYKYIIYTDLDNNDYKNNLYAIKVIEINNNIETIPINEDEWKMINDEYMNIIK